MNTATPQLWTALAISRALGSKKRQAIQRELKRVEPSGTLLVSGNAASGWHFIALPARLQTELSSEAQRRGYRTAEAMLAAPAAPLLPAFTALLRACPLDRVRAEFISKAIRLRDALAAPLAQQHTLDNQQLAELGLREFNRAFAYGISAKHWNRLFDRTVLRDNGMEQFHRVELYLDDAALRQPVARVAVVAKQFDHSALRQALDDLLKKETLTLDDQEQLWCSAFHHLEALEQAGSKQAAHQAQASVIAFLFSAFQRLAKSLPSLRRTFSLKLGLWRAGGRTLESIRDHRRLTSGNFRVPLCGDCRQTLISLAVAHDGNESLAYRLARTRNLLCEPCTAGHAFNPRVNKSAVPEVVRAQITPLIESVLPLHRGPREAQMRGPYILRDWSGVQPGDWFSADDITWNHYFRSEEAGGNPVITRGECLLQIDLRTGYPLEFSIIAGKYNSEHIRALILKTHDAVGLPRCGFYYERSVWASRLIDGDRRDGNPAHWRETELGLRERGLNLDVRHATTPRAKTIEGLIHILQDRMRSIPGFVGFNERTDRRERVQAVLSRAYTSAGAHQKGRESTARNEAALASLPTLDEWRRTVRAVLDEFAHDPQNGKMLNGATPVEAWQEGTSRRPLKRLPDEARFILSTHRKPVRVQQHGIALTIRGQKFLYANEHTGALIGRDVLAFYNVAAPELLTVSDMKSQNYFTLKRIELPAMSATDAQFAEAHSQIRGHRASAKVLYGEIKHDLVSTISRDGEHDEATKELGRFHNAEVQAHAEQKSERTRKLNQIQKAAAVSGAAFVGPVKNPDRVLQGQELARQYRERLASKEQKS